MDRLAPLRPLKPRCPDCGARIGEPHRVPRDEKVEEALAAATAGDMEPFRTLLDVVRHPVDERPGLEDFAVPAPSSFAGAYCTFCGT